MDARANILLAIVAAHVKAAVTVGWNLDGSIGFPEERPTSCAIDEVVMAVELNLAFESAGVE